MGQGWAKDGPGTRRGSKIALHDPTSLSVGVERIVNSSLYQVIKSCI